MGGIALFMWATDLEVHYELRRTELDESRVINVNRKSANRTDQHALILRKGEMPASWMGGQAVGGPGSPRDVTEVRIAPGMGGWWSSAKRKRDYGALVAHELLHAVNVFHHGDKDRGMVQWSRGTDSDGKPAILESPLDARGRPRGTGQPVRVFNENGTEYRPDAPQFKSPRKLWVSMPNGQHSGHDQCLMRYDCAQAYDAGVTALVLQRYVISGDEPTGFELCATPDGTGVNAPARRPRPRHGKAATDRGGCVHQVLVSDEFPAVNRD